MASQLIEAFTEGMKKLGFSYDDMANQMYSQDINRKTGYMVFMTPNNGYTIIGSKVITALIEGLGMLIFFILVVALNSLIVYGPSNFFEINFNNVGISYTNIFIVLTTILLFAIQFLLTIYAAITIRKSILANVKLKGLISFGIFILLNYIITKIYTIPYDIFGYSKYSGMVDMTRTGELIKMLTPSMLTSTMLCVALTFLSGYLLEKKINL